MAQQYLLPFNKGLNTDQGLITGDPGFSRDESNVTLLKDGSRRVRLGLDYEAAARLAITGTNINETAFTSYTWLSAGNTDKTFIVLQQGYKLHFFDASAPNLIAGYFSLVELIPTPYYTPITASDSKVQFTSGNGALFVAGLKFEPTRIVYTGTNLTQTTIKIEIRDYYGVPDGVPTDLRPTSLTADNKYNLFNQGWYQKANNRSGTPLNVIDEFFNVETTYPAKIYQWWRGKRESDNGKFYSEDLRNAYTGTLEAPKGHFVIDAFRRNYSRADLVNSALKQEWFGGAVSGPASFTYVSKDEERTRPSCVAWYAGRLFWAGAMADTDGALSTTPDITGYLFYSQTVRSDTDYGKCYQIADPTAEDDSGIVATDGGFMVFPGAGSIKRLVVVMDSLVILTDRQIVAVRGGDAGFTAEFQQSYKILDSGIASAGCVAVAEGALFVWARDGIYTISYSNQTGGLTAQSISAGKIQDYLTLVNPAQQATVQAVYDPLNKRVSWWYNSDSTYNGATDSSRLLTELSYDLLLTAFTRNQLATSVSKFATAPFYTDSPKVTVVANPVVSGADTVVSGADSVTVGGAGYSFSANQVYTFIVDSVFENVGVAYYKSNTYLDYGTSSYTAYLLGSNDILGNAVGKKYPVYMRCQFKRTEYNFINNGAGQPTLDNPSSCKLQTRWDFSDSTNSGKWSNDQEVYRFTRAYMPGSIGDIFDYGQEVITTKTKITGTGKALAVKFSAVPGKGYHLLGYSFEGVPSNAY